MFLEDKTLDMNAYRSIISQCLEVQIKMRQIALSLDLGNFNLKQITLNVTCLSEISILFFALNSLIVST